MSILVVAAHPDDEVLGCGGTISGLTQTEEVHILILGEGIMARADGDSRDVDRLHATAHEVGRLLGVKGVETHRFPDNAFDTVPLLEIIKIVEKTVDRLRPEIVFTHHKTDLNIDHKVTHWAVLTATRPLPGQSVKEVFSFEVLSSTEWSFDGFRPTMFMGISNDDMLRKCNALKMYGEARDFPHPRSTRALLAAAERWGSTVGTEWAEAFECIRIVR